MYPCWASGFNLFPEEYRRKYKIRMSYEVVDKFAQACTANLPSLNEVGRYPIMLISIKSISRKEN